MERGGSGVRRILPWAAPLVFLGVFLLLVFLRVDRIDALIGPELDCPGCLNRSVLIHDAPYVGVVLACMLGGFALPFGVWAVCLRLVAFVGVLLYGMDLAVSWQLSTRLHIADLRVFAAQPAVLGSHLAHTGLVNWPTALAALLGCACFLFIPRRLPCGRKTLAVLALPPVVLLGAGLVLDPGRYVRDWALFNVVEVNFETGAAKPYRRIDEIAAAPESRFCAPGTESLSQGKGDLIVLILESWSPYQSALLGELNDWTPRLDAIARDNQYYSHMVAAGFATHEGLMGVLTGMEFLSPVKSFFEVKPFETSWGQSRTLPRLLGERGYRSAFFTSGNLAFMGKGEWLRDVGFDHVEGHDHPFYQNQPRLHFDSPPDGTLYAHVLDYIDQGTGGTPRLIVVENVSSHHPFIQPLTLEHSEEAVFRYMDKTVGDFYDALKAKGFLERGNLLIVGDHRAMVPLRPGEHARWGRSSLSRIPAIWAGAGTQQLGEISAPFHQADILDTVEWNVSPGEVCSARGLRDMLHPERTSPACLFHARGDRRDRIDVFCTEGEGTIQLAGDRTAMREWDAAPGFEEQTREVQQAAVTKLNRYRVDRDKPVAATKIRRKREAV
ncbi:hypothetical protein AGMMS49543_00670 [Betaproteobacteria bacterium]|nr:hypothetical protein AGMMS49543_00670 [Betaproteobacteria bacterium]GHU16050.1 hypothetical protein AGMMS50243_01260 [Betaproteobacteria bacterium]